MPKMKTHSGAKKRFRVTRRNKVIHDRVNQRHLLEGKSSRRKRRLASEGELSSGDAKRVKRLLGLR